MKKEKSMNLNKFFILIIAFSLCACDDDILPKNDATVATVDQGLDQGNQDLAEFPIQYMDFDTIEIEPDFDDPDLPDMD
tara:strand:+ start:778 stop:1014 length:237 start_codon:yes stop_codon:yes gene_type:complete